MHQWPLIELGELCDFAYGKALPQKKRSGSGFPVYGSNGVVGYHDEAFTGGPAIVVGRKGSIGKVNFSETGCWPIDTTYFISPKTDFDYRWFYYMLKSLNLEDLNKAATIPGLNRNDAYAIKIPLPPLAEQKRIAAILDKADRLQQLRAQQLQKLDELLQSVFVGMFGDPVRNPMGWPVKKLGEVVKLQGGYAFKSESYQNFGVPLVRIGNANKKRFNLTELRFLPADFVQKYPQYLLYPGDLTITLTGTTGKDDYGNVNVVPETFERYFLNQRVAKIEINTDIATQQFLRFLMRQETTKKEIIKNSRGIRQANLRDDDIYGVSLPFPPISAQFHFDTIVGRLEAVVENCQKNAIGNLAKMGASQFLNF